MYMYMYIHVYVACYWMISYKQIYGDCTCVHVHVHVHVCVIKFYWDVLAKYAAVF